MTLLLLLSPNAIVVCTVHVSHKMPFFVQAYWDYDGRYRLDNQMVANDQVGFVCFANCLQDARCPVANVYNIACPFCPELRSKSGMRKYRANTIEDCKMYSFNTTVCACAAGGILTCSMPRNCMNPMPVLHRCLIVLT